MLYSSCTGKQFIITLFFTLNKAVYWRRVKIHFTIPHYRKFGLSCTHKNTNFVFYESVLVVFIRILSIDLFSSMLFLLFLHFLYFQLHAVLGFAAADSLFFVSLSSGIIFYIPLPVFVCFPTSFLCTPVFNLLIKSGFVVWRLLVTFLLLVF